MQKGPTQINVPFQHAISDITGVTGLAVLAKLWDPHIKASEEIIRKLLEGN